MKRRIRIHPSPREYTLKDLENPEYSLKNILTEDFHKRYTWKQIACAMMIRDKFDPQTKSLLIL